MNGLRVVICRLPLPFDVKLTIVTFDVLQKRRASKEDCIPACFKNLLAFFGKHLALAFVLKQCAWVSEILQHI